MSPIPIRPSKRTAGKLAFLSLMSTDSLLSRHRRVTNDCGLKIMVDGVRHQKPLHQAVGEKPLLADGAAQTPRLLLLAEDAVAVEEELEGVAIVVVAALNAEKRGICLANVLKEEEVVVLEEEAVLSVAKRAICLVSVPKEEVIDVSNAKKRDISHGIVRKEAEEDVSIVVKTDICLVNVANLEQVEVVVVEVAATLVTEVLTLVLVTIGAHLLLPLR